MLKEDSKSKQNINYTIIIMSSTSAGSPINNRPTITEIPSPPITMIPISTEIPDSGISSTDSTRSIPLSVLSIKVRCCP